MNDPISRRKPARFPSQIRTAAMHTNDISAEVLLAVEDTTRGPDDFCELMNALYGTNFEPVRGPEGYPTLE